MTVKNKLWREYEQRMGGKCANNELCTPSLFLESMVNKQLQINTHTWGILIQTEQNKTTQITMVSVYYDIIGKR